MRVNCLRNMAASLHLLQPTLVISQGVSLSKPSPAGHRTLTVVSSGHPRFVWAELQHPTYHWDWLVRPSVQQIVVPTLTLGRERALELAAS